ncbi:MAG: hydrolase Nlp/P60 [Bacteroidetes bacterium]|nr:MAG: hydrolase Nlp/P60 [Bacteroidota bacterium]
MKYGFCEQAVVPVRSQPGEQQEMTNQLLFGDLVFVKDSLNDWLLIETSNDNYEGWIDKKQIQIIDQNIFKDHQKEHPIYSLELCSNAVSESKKALRLTMGARLPNYSNGHFQIKDQLYYFTGNTSNPKEKAGNKQIVQTAQNYLGSPYLWGGRSPFGIDCSGFTQIVFKMCGKQLQRDASQQIEQGETVNLLQEAKAADLAFFENREGNINHVGILLNNTSIIHAYGIVRIDEIDHQGIYNTDTKKYTHQLRIIKRILFQ